MVRGLGVERLTEDKIEQGKRTEAQKYTQRKPNRQTHRNRLMTAC